jgi:hypothetical protein
MKPNCFGHFVEECKKSGCLVAKYCFLRTNAKKKIEKRKK